MRLRKIIIVSFLLYLIPTLALGQLKKQQEAIDMPTALKTWQGEEPRSFSLFGIDPTKFRMTHSYTLSYFSIGGKGFSQGVYLNTMSYQFSEPLLLKLQWGAYHQPFGGLANNNLLNKGLFFSGAELSYKPSDKFFIKLQYHSLPYGVYDPYYRNYYRGRDWFEEEE